MAVNIIITDAGRAEVINAENTGTDPVTIAEVGFGSGQYAPNASQTALVSEFKRLNTISGQVVADDVIHVSVRDSSTQAYDVYELGIYTESGTLFAVYSQIGSPILEKSAQTVALMAVDIAIKSLNATSLTFGDTDFTNPPASTTVQGVVLLATDADVLAGTESTKVVTPAALNARSATTSRTGLVELATTGETITGTDSQRAVTPAGLAAVTSTTDRRGLVELATVAETQAGTDTERAVTPAGLAGFTATTEKKGMVELATVSETKAGTDGQRAVTPAGAKGLVDQQIAAIGLGSAATRDAGDMYDGQLLPVGAFGMRYSGGLVLGNESIDNIWAFGWYAVTDQMHGTVANGWPFNGFVGDLVVTRDNRNAFGGIQGAAQTAISHGTPARIFHRSCNTGPSFGPWVETFTTGNTSAIGQAIITATDQASARAAIGAASESYVDKIKQDWSTASQIGSKYELTGLIRPVIAMLQKGLAVLVDQGLDQIRALSWDGSSFSQVGSALAVSNCDAPFVCALSGTDVALVTINPSKLRVYRFSSNTFNQIGSDFSITTSGNPSICALSATDIAIADDSGIATYRWNDSTWALLGSKLSVSGSGKTITALDGSNVAVIRPSSGYVLEKYNWNGSSWLKVGSSLTLAGSYSAKICAINSTDVVVNVASRFSIYRFDGENWIKSSADYTNSVSDGILCSINGTDFAYAKMSNEIIAYRYHFSIFSPHSKSSGSW